MAEQWDPQRESFVEFLIRNHAANQAQHVAAPASVPVAPSGSAPVPVPAPLPAGADPALAPEQDPAYLAFKRGLDSQRSDAERSTNERLAALDALLSPLNADVMEMGRQHDLTQQRVSGQMEARGLSRSGSRQRAMADVDTGYAHALGSRREAIAAERSSVQNALAAELRRLEQSGSEALLDTSNRLQTEREQRRLNDQLQRGLEAIQRGQAPNVPPPSGNLPPALAPLPPPPPVLPPPPAPPAPPPLVPGLPPKPGSGLKRLRDIAFAGPTYLGSRP